MIEPDNPFVADGVPQWGDAVDYLKERALTCDGQQRDLLCAIAKMIEGHAGDGGVSGLVPIAQHPLSQRS